MVADRLNALITNLLRLNKLENQSIQPRKNPFDLCLQLEEPDSGTVALKLEEEDDYAVVKVSDTVCGMDEKTKAHIFDKFYQGDTSHATEGNGLGLALVQRILQITGGALQVDSIPGQGSVFTVTLRKKLDE